MPDQPVASYRLQLHPGFGFEQAQQLIPYLKALGISHIYTSPYLQAAKDSMHGYDVVNPGLVNQQLGGESAHEAFCEAIQAAGMSHLIDIVPNHMAIAGKQNPWWWDVLQNGQASRFATYFDVDWETSEERWPNKVLLPVLGDHYGRILEAGELELHYLRGEFELHYHEHVFPIDPSSLSGLLSRAAAACGSDTLAFIAESYARVPRPSVMAQSDVEQRHRDKKVLSDLLARQCKEDAGSCAAIEEQVRRLNRDPDAMDRLIDQQNYRLALWRTASRDLGYRRFFDITDLAGVRAERLEVFHASHALPIRWVRKGWVQGLRVDHPDGLRDPTEYFNRLRRVCPNAWLLGEKILEPGERLPPTWPIEGTTGYDFLNLLGGVFVESNHADTMDTAYREFIGEDSQFDQVANSSKREVLTELLVSELNRLTNLFVDVCEKHRRHRDYTSYELREALLETAACFPVYRSYVSPGSRTLLSQDIEHIDKAIEDAQQARTDVEPELFEFLRKLLKLKVPGRRESELAMRFQQLTGPAMAKGIEDTAFYRYHRLVALNEVGGDPDHFGISLEEFHQGCVTTQAEYPFTMLAGTTHDTKRSEDVRARIAVLSEVPDEWQQAVFRWRGLNSRFLTESWPDPNTEYLFYQTLVGAWPITTERLLQFAEKACRESKIHTSWTKQNEAYETAVQAFIKGIMQHQPFIEDLQQFVDRIVQAGRINSLAQTLVRLTAPGVPDVYQGNELWDLSLVDPDNRRPVDFEQRSAQLHQLLSMSVTEISAAMDSGLPKMWTIRQTLQLRQRVPACFGAEGDYQPLMAEGSRSRHLLAYMRGQRVAVLVPRLTCSLDNDWQDTRIELPAGRWHNVLADQSIEGGQIFPGQLFQSFPTALLIREESGE